MPPPHMLPPRTSPCKVPRNLFTLPHNTEKSWVWVESGREGKGQPQIRGKYLLFKQKMKEFGPRGGGEPYHPLGSANNSVIIAHLIYPNRPVSISK